MSNNEKEEKMTKIIAEDLLKFIDLTSLNDEDTNESILQFLSYSHCKYGHVAAVCVYSKFIPVVLEYINLHKLPINLATVVNFPKGDSDILKVKYDIIDAINAGANEIDIVMPYKELMVGNQKAVQDLISMARETCGDRILKVIIESGELDSSNLIKLASEICLENEVDFIKTSTGKTSVGATVEAATTILSAIKESGGNCGFKVSGGVSSIEVATQYAQLVEKILGEEALTPKRFRIGTSKLVKAILGDAISGEGY